MITIKQAEEILKTGISTGADFCEIYIEDTLDRSVEAIGGEVSRISNSNRYGTGIRIIKDEYCVYGNCTSTEYEELIALAKNLASSFNEDKLFDFQLNGEIEDKIEKPVLAIEEKKNLLLKVSQEIKNYSKEISQSSAYIYDIFHEVYIFNTKGVVSHDVRHNLRFMVGAIAQNEKGTQSAFDSLGANKDYSFFDNKEKFVELAQKVAKTAITMLHADEMIPGVYPVVINNGFGGVILHEACVHGLEASCVAKGQSVFCGKLNQQIASKLVTAVDDGTILDGWGSLNFDDEGTKTRRNVLIEEGILKSYLVDYKNAKKMNHEITGSSRRESHYYAPTSRMTNTFICNGESTFEEIIANTKYGLFASQMGGGSVNPTTGEFNFAVVEGYMIEDGKITKPVRGATLVGKGSDVLFKIDMVGNNLKYGYGMCGAESGLIPTIVGQPTIRVSSMIVGGRGEKE